MRTLKMLALVLCALFVTLTAGCAISEETAEVVPPTAAVVPTTTAPVEPAEPTTEPAAELPLAVTYDLGDATVVQANFPEDSRFRNMPVRLNGVIAAPAGEGPYPVVVILHGTHPGCPVDEMGVDRWPCDPADEQANYSGFAYLVSELAARGYQNYETSAFARPGRRCAHNLNYWTFGDYLGIGAGAHGKIGSAFGIVREMRRKHPRDYLDGAVRGDFVQERHEIAAADLPFEFMMNALRLCDGFPARLYAERTGLSLAGIREPLQAARHEGLLTTDAERIAPTARGRRFLNALLRMFLPDA